MRANENPHGANVGASDLADQTNVSVLLAAAGVPLFVASVNPSYVPGYRGNDKRKSKEFKRPYGWQQTPATGQVPHIPSGAAVCAVTGHVVDVVDVDTKNGADVDTERERLGGCGVVILGEVRTPSGGAHFYVAASGIRTAAEPSNGIDFRGGGKDGGGRGNVFLPGTSRPAYGGKGYVCVTPFDLAMVDELDREDQSDCVWTYLQGRGITPKLEDDPQASTVEGEPVDCEVPESIADRLSLLSVPDRSAHFHGTVGVCKRAGFTQGQTVTLLTPWCNAVGKYAGRVAVEVARSWGKIKEPTESTESTESADDRLPGEFQTVPLGRKLAAHLRGQAIYVANVGWHLWDGTRWAPSDDDHMLAKASDWAEDQLRALVSKQGFDVDSRAVKALQRYRDVGMVRQLLAGARTDTAILVDAGDLDQNPGLLNCNNGVVELRTKKLLPHDPALLMTKTTGTDYVPGATHPDWNEKALSALDTETAEFLQVYAGSAASGELDRGAQVLVQRGDGCNGKTTVTEGISHAFGEYATQVPDKLLHGSGNEHDTLWMPLRGTRWATIEELPEGHQLPVARLKKLADVSEITGRYIGRDYVTFNATHNLSVNTNYAPRVAETDHGTWRRLLMIEYSKTFDGATKDPTLKRRLRNKAQAQAILAWVVDGAAKWYENGCDLPEPPPAVAAATAEWRADSDPLGTFLDENICFTDSAEDRIPTTTLLDRFNESQPTGAKAWSATLFGQRLKSHHVVKNGGASVNRGHRNQHKMALTHATWKTSAQGAQGHFRDSHEKNKSENLRHNPAHPAHPHKSPNSSTVTESSPVDEMGGCAAAGYAPGEELSDKKCTDCGERISADRDANGKTKCSKCDLGRNHHV